VGGSVPVGTTSLGSLLEPGESFLMMQLLTFEPMLGLGKFELAQHQGIRVTNLEFPDSSRLVKISNAPDSNNVFLAHEIAEPCFAEFKVIACSDVMLFGVTHDVERTVRASGFSNLRLTCTWTYAKHSCQMPHLVFGGVNMKHDQGFKQNDLVAVYVDPAARQVKFYRNSELVADNLPDYPLPAGGGLKFGMYVQVDATDDEIQIARFGPGEPYI